MTIAIVGVRHGFRWSLLSVVSAIIAIAFLLGPLTAIVEGGVFGVIGILIGYGLSKHWSISKLLMIPAVVLMLAVVVQFWASALVMQVSPTEMWSSLEEQITVSMQDMYVQQGLSEEQVTTAMTALQDQIEIMKKSIDCRFILLWCGYFLYYQSSHVYCAQSYRYLPYS